MTRRIQKLVMTVAALAALALGGAVFAQAQTSPTPVPERTSATDTDNVQSGDQTTPDKPGSTADKADSAAGATGAESPESSSESAAPNDGPGGHADPAGSANADHQFQGNE
jgi:hypothetical protein